MTRKVSQASRPLKSKSSGLTQILRPGTLLTAAIAGLFALSAFLTPSTASAQAGKVVTIAVPDNQRELFNNTIIPEFEKTNPGITVQSVSQALPANSNPATDTTAHLDAIQSFVSQADVILVRSTDVTPEGTRAGYFLNLQPLVSGDAALNSDDFFPSVLKAFQWDQGMWALPLSFDATVMIYDPAAFDAANVTYPTPQWTLTDLINAAKKLTVTDASGAITTPGIELFRGGNELSLYMSLLGRGLYDPNMIPNPPLITQPEVQSLVDALPDLYAVVPAQSNTFGAAPMQIGSIRTLLFGNRGNNAAPLKGTLLPGGHAYLDVSGVAVSASSQNPEAAYTFAKFLTTRADIGGRGRTYPARQSLVAQTANAGGPGGGARGPGGGPGAVSPETQQLYADAIANGLTATDRRYFNYLSSAIQQIQTNKIDTASALATAQQNAQQNAQLALDRKNDASKVAVVATAVPVLAASDGIVLKFGVAANGGQGNIPNKAAIQAIADEFVKQNRGVVGRVEIYPVNGGPNGVADAAKNFDAFYVPYSVVSSVALDSILALDPFLTADSTYNAQDYVGGTLTQVTRDNKVWALPMGIQPTVMWYDPVTFANTGVTKPTPSWDVSAFSDSLKQLAPAAAAGTPPFAAQSDLGSSLLMLMASYGGLPIDYRTNPVTVDFTSQKNVDAMRQVLDLARNGLITYEPLARSFGFFARGGNLDNPIYSQVLNGFNFRPNANPNAANANRFVPVTYPQGTQQQLVAYSLSTLYVSASAQNADASYRWIKMLAGHPEVFRLMPAQHSALNNPNMDTAYGAPLAQTYRDIATILDNSKTITAPSIIGGFANLQNLAVQHWLYQAWDNYVAKGGDFAADLNQAQQFATGFLQCTANVPPFDPKSQTYGDYQQALLKCATQVDPSLANF